MCTMDEESFTVAEFPALTEDQRTQMIAYLHLLNENRETLREEAERRQAARDVDWSGLAWWEYR